MNLPHIPFKDDKLFGCLFLAALLLPLAFSLFTYENFEVLKYALLLLLTGVGLFVVLWRPAVAFYSARPKLFWLALAGFWLWAALSTIGAWDKNLAIFGFYPRFTNGLIFYSAWSVLLLLLGFLDGPKLAWLLKVLVLTAGLVAIWGLLQSVGFGFYAGLNSDFFNRIAPSFFGNPDFSSMYLAALLPLCVAFFCQSSSLKSKIYYGLSGFFQLWALAIFASRGALAALAAGLLVALLLAVVFWAQRPRRWLLVILLASVMALYFGRNFLDFSRPTAVAQTVDFSQDSNIQDRLGIWKLSLASIVKRPLAGVGLGNFELMFEHDRRSSIIASGFFDDAHNLPLELAVTGGLPLALFFFSLIAIAAWQALKSLQQKWDDQTAALVAALTAWFVAAMFTPVVIPCYALLAFLLAACLPKAPVDVKPSGYIKYPLSLLAIGFILWAAAFLTGEILFYYGRQDYEATSYSSAYRLLTLATDFNSSNRLYYVYRTGTAILSGQPLAEDGQLLAKTASYNSRMGLSHDEMGNLYYLMLYQTKNPVYIKNVLGQFEAAISADPYSANNYFALSSYQIAFGNLAGAQASALHGLAIGGGNEEGEIFLAKTYQLQGNKPALLEALQRAVAVSEGDLGVIKLLERMQRATDIQAATFDLQLPLGQLN